MTLPESGVDFLVDLNDPAKRRVSIDILFETPGGRLQLYRALIDRGNFASLRDNLAPVCWPCNYEKRGMTVDEWRRWRIASGKRWPPLPRDGADSLAVEYENPDDVPIPWNYRPPPRDMQSPALKLALERERARRARRAAA